MANPRKFSEKIALHHQKQAEETAAFEQIMRDVANVTNKVTGGGRGLAPALGPLRAGSLPDVSLQIPNDNLKPDEVTLTQYTGGGGTSPDSGGGGGGDQGGQQGGAGGRQGTAPSLAQTRGRPAGVGPMRARPMDRRIDTSPYGSTAYLSPPPDSSWRRTNSDSALHQSSAAPRDPSPHHHHHNHNQQHHHHNPGQVLLHHQPSSPLHFSNTHQTLPQQHQTQGGHMQHHHYSHSHQALNTALQTHNFRRDGNWDGMNSMLDANPNRPRSSCEVPRVPGINIYPSSHDSGSVQIPVSSNTGSLPDLTSVHFPPQLHGPSLDREPPDHGAGTPYSNSPASASPATLSPTSVATTGRSGPSPHHSPRHSPHGSPTTPHHYTNHHQNHLSVPNTNRYLHHSKGVALESPWMQSSYQQQCSPPSLHSSHSNINIPSPTMGVSPVQVSTTNGSGYRSPRSPGSSPGGAGGGSNGSSIGGGSSVGPGGTNGGSVTGGDSPHYDSSYSQGDNFFINQALQHHFEQFSMDWAQLVQSLVESGVTWTAQVQTDSPSPNLNYINSVNANQTQFIQATLGGEGVEGGGGGGGVWAGGGPCLSGPAPNTPTTIPDIILTDFSSTTGSTDLSKELSNSLASQLSKDLSASMGGHFDSPLFPEDEGLRETLGTIDFDGFQMLTDPAMNVISDPTTEDVFRQDRL